MISASVEERWGSGQKGWWGSNMEVEFDGIKQLGQVERWKVPGSGVGREGDNADTERRLIVIGDIHGCIDERTFSFLHSICYALVVLMYSAGRG